MDSKRTTQVRITTAAAKALREQAAALGYVIKRGPMKGYGDGAAMLEAIAAGRIELKKIPQHGTTERPTSTAIAPFARFYEAVRSLVGGDYVVARANDSKGTVYEITMADLKRLVKEGQDEQ